MTQIQPDITDRARELYNSEDIQIDEEPRVCRAEKGVWVQAWVWVPDEVESS